MRKKEEEDEVQIGRGARGGNDRNVRQEEATIDAVLKVMLIQMKNACSV